MRSVADRHSIAVIPGDGIGLEVVPSAQEVLERAGALYGVGLGWHELPWSSSTYLESGRMMPEDGIDRLREHDAIFLGAVGDPQVPDHVSLWGLLIPIRRSFQQYVNVRPMRLLPGIDSPLRGVGAGEVDLVVVRENVEGEYSEVGGRLYRGTPQELAVQEAVFTRRGVERVVRHAFGLAERRGGHVTSATKSNGIIHTMPFWDEVVREVAARFPRVPVRSVLIDALCALAVLHPERLDVVVGSNLFGDILSDLTAAVAGSIGIAPSANLNPEREHPSMFEPVHGSAPDIAGRGVANPIGQIWSGALMLEHLGHPQAGAAVMRAVERVLGDGGPRTADLGGTATTAEVTAAVVEALEGPTPEAEPAAPAIGTTRSVAASVPGLRALTFDVFGTVVDWYGTLVEEGEALGRRLGLEVDWDELARAWRGRYRPAMDRVRHGELPRMGFDALHRMTLEEVLSERGIELPAEELDEYAQVWHRLRPWPDAVAGLERLADSYVLATLSNGGVGLLTEIAKRGRLAFDCILSGELWGTYKPDPAVYLGAAQLLDLVPEQLMMVAAHAYDLKAARELGLRVAFVERPLEYGPRAEHPDLPPDPSFELVARDLEDLAAQLGGRPPAW